MNIIFLTLIDIHNVNDRGIYHDLLRKFRDKGHKVYVIYPVERRKKLPTAIIKQDGITLLRVHTLNIQKTNLFEKGIGTLLLEKQFLKQLKKNFSEIKFNLVLYSTPPITLTKVVQYIKQKCGAKSYLLLKDIFPQNAVDLGMIKAGSVLHKFFSKKERQLYQVSDFIGCMSLANVNFVLNHNPEIDARKVEVNPNSITPKPFILADKNTVRKKYQIPDTALVFVYGGNLGKPQGISFLIEILEENDNNNEIFFVVVGEGTEHEKIRRWFQKKRPANALLMQSMDKLEYDQLIRACDVGLIFLDKRFTIPNFPSRLLSYLENRMPVIAATDKNTDIGKVIEDNLCGFWSESGDLEGFNNHLRHFITNKHLIKEMGENSYNLLMREYTVEVSYDSIIRRVKS